MLMAMEVCKIIREKLGYNQNQMAVRLGMSRQAYRALEVETVNPTKKVLLKLRTVVREELGWDAEMLLDAWEKIG